MSPPSSLGVSPRKVLLVRPTRPSSAKSFVREEAGRSKAVAAENPPPYTPPKGGVMHGGDSAVGKKHKIGLGEILAAAEELNPSERKQLLDHLSLKRATATSAGEMRDVEMWSLAVYEALGDAISAGAGGQQGPAIVRRVAGAPQAFAPVAEFMHSSRMQEMKAPERQAVYGLLARLCVDRAKEVSGFSGAPVSAKLVVQASQGMAAVFERSFPGYLASGLAKLVARQLVTPS